MTICLEVRSQRGRPIAQQSKANCLILGSGADCDFVVAGEGFEFSHVAARHARIQLSPQGATLEDLGSPKGTWINGKCVQQPLAIKAGSRFSLGRLGPTVIVTALEWKDETSRSGSLPLLTASRAKGLVMAGLAALIVGLWLAGWGLTFPLELPSQLTAASTEEQALASEAREFLAHYCNRCHEAGSNETTFAGALDLKVLLSESSQDAYILPGDPANSRVWQVIEQGTMPKAGPKPDEKQKARFRAWIEAGAPAWSSEVLRKNTPQSQVLQAIAQDLRTADLADRQFRRYLTLHHLYNNSFNNRAKGINISDEHLHWTRAAVSKTINSLSWKEAIQQPRSIGPEATVLVIDLRDYGWSEADWEGLVASYPYGLRWDTHLSDQSSAHAAKEIDHFSQTELPFIRADWFVVKATSPEHYYNLLHLPKTVSELETLLGVDSRQEILEARARRSGFRQSGVSKNNRLLDRHETRIGPGNHGYYWRSYDFLQNISRGNLQQFPLGPQFPGNVFQATAFQEDGGEMIFTLPNGLQAYYLASGDGSLLGTGPIQVVQDNNQVSGTPEIVCAQSCIYCHRTGIITFTDSIRDNTSTTGNTLQHVKRLFAEPHEMAGLIAADQNIFEAALRKAVGDFMPIGEVLGDVAEPIGKVALWYHGPSSDLSIEDVAAELHVDREQLEALAAVPAVADRVGLGAFRENGLIKRESWEASYQKVAWELYGIEPIVPKKSP